jgi:hypothetical protein
MSNYIFLFKSACKDHDTFIILNIIYMLQNMSTKLFGNILPNESETPKEKTNRSVGPK